MSGQKDPLVSVVMPACRCRETICRAIDSVLAQETALELLVVDDEPDGNLLQTLQVYRGRPDVCFLEAEKEESGHDGGGENRAVIRYIKNDKNLGAAASRNRGVALARGQYIAFLDADDWWEKGKLPAQIALLQKTGAALCCTARELVTAKGEPTGRVIPVKEEITYRQLLHQNSINCSSVLIRADVMKQFQMEHEDSHEDYLLWLRILKKYQRACGINQPLLKYRTGSQGKSGSKLKSARMTFLVYRYAGFGKARSCWYFCCYAWNGFWKYFRARTSGFAGKRGNHGNKSIGYHSGL